MVPGISAVGEGRGRGLVAELGPVPANVGGLGSWGLGYRASVGFVFPGHLTSTCDECC